MKLFGFCLIASVAALAACSAAPGSDEVQSGHAADTTPAACTPATQADALAHALAAPIQPPRFSAGLDLAGDDAWTGIKQATVETALCAGTSQGSDDATVTDPENYFSWGGDAQPFFAGFSQATGKLAFVELNPGYTGSVDFKSRDGAHTYSAKVGGQVMRDGVAMTFDWTANLNPAGTEIVDALVATFAPSLTAVDCSTSQRCLLRVVPEDNTTTPPTPAMAILGSRDVHFYMTFPTAGDATAMSTSQYFYMFPQAPGFTPPPPPPNP
jgi:hypothetical protein